MTRILLVDGSAADRRLVADLLQRYGGNVDVIYANRSIEALEAIGRLSPDVVLAALPADASQFLNVIEEIHAKEPSLPIILITGDFLTPLVLQALLKGAINFVSRGNMAHCLARTLENMLELSRSERRHQRLVGYMCQTESSFCLENDPELVGQLVAHIQESAARMNGVDETDRMQLGIALHEALLNALYHGNLEVSSQLREAGETAYLEHARERRRTVPWRDRRIHVKTRMSPAEVVFVIRDEGPGFNPDALPDPTAPENLAKASGRGILLMRSFVDDMRYNATGNELTLIKKIRTDESTE
jgi:CheY-like chemotaxis protein/anti-sigma regulatory factor (Ser/Thr protein kinase)